MVQEDVENQNIENEAIIKAKMLTSFSQYFNEIYVEFLDDNIGLKDFIKDKALFVKQWGIVRVDIKSSGSDSNSLRFINLDDDITVSHAGWLTDETGEGFKVTSEKNNIRFTFRCINDGELVLRFRGAQFRHVLTRERVPVKIFANNVKINNKDSFNNKLLWHDDPFVYTMSCTDGEIITIEMETRFIYDYYPKLRELCDNIENNDNIVSSVDSLKNYFINPNDKELFEDLHLNNFYLTKKYDELSRNDGTAVDEFIKSNKNLYDVISMANKDENEHLIMMFEEFLNISSINGEFNPDRFRKLLIYLEGRVDIVNYGENGDIELVYCSDNQHNFRIPGWIKDGSGIVIESKKGVLDLIVKCIGDGDVKFSFRSTDVRDKTKQNRLPIYIDFTNITINDESIIDERKLITHDAPLNFTRKFKDSECISLHMEWESFSADSTFE